MSSFLEFLFGKSQPTQPNNQNAEPVTATPATTANKPLYTEIIDYINSTNFKPDEYEKFEANNINSAYEKLKDGFNSTNMKKIENSNITLYQDITNFIDKNFTSVENNRNYQKQMLYIIILNKLNKDKGLTMPKIPGGKRAHKTGKKRVKHVAKRTRTRTRGYATTWTNR